MTEYRYYDNLKAQMIIGSLLKRPDLFETDEAKRIVETDFADPLHRLTYFTLHNLYHEGHSELTGSLIDGYLESRPRLLKMFNERDGYNFVNEAIDVALPSSFKPNVEAFKKFALLRGMESIGVNVDHILNWDTEDEGLWQTQLDYVENHSVLEIGEEISSRIDEELEKASASGGVLARSQGGEGLEELIESFKEAPEMGSPLYGKIMNTVLRGARLGKFYLRSSPTGGGKSRAMMADAVNFAVDEIYDTKKKKWVENGVKEPSLFITTELSIEECQTLEISFVTGIEEDKFLDHNFTEEEYEVVKKGVSLLEEAPFWIEHIPDFSIQEIERIIRRNVRENGVKYVA